MPKPYIFNNVLGMDVLFLADAAGTEFVFLNLVGVGTDFQLVILLREGSGTPTSMECLDAVMLRWVSWAGFPREMLTDRGVNQKGYS